MKRILSVLAMVVWINSFAQIKEGKITYKVELQGAAAAVNAVMGDMQLDLSFKNDKSLMQMHMKLTALKVSTEPVPDTTFLLSTDGYEKMDMDKLKGQQNMQL